MNIRKHHKETNSAYKEQKNLLNKLKIGKTNNYLNLLVNEPRDY